MLCGRLCIEQEGIDLEQEFADRADTSSAVNPPYFAQYSLLLRMVQEVALTALASVADSSQEHFQKYYDVVMPYLKSIMMTITEREVGKFETRGNGNVKVGTKTYDI
ncbi:hypothetical protein Taro_005717 [Colocasia esculenta]|uniref:Uncharacterized protein n=1 Tax=Colocasia esculenta TaxID=4460 RepID=A0A843TVC6_COLES|nr:hypothetical protein [Colocasia esculenta]